MYIYEHKDWPLFSWNEELVEKKLNKVAISEQRPPENR